MPVELDELVRSFISKVECAAAQVALEPKLIFCKKKKKKKHCKNKVKKYFV